MKASFLFSLFFCQLIVACASGRHKRGADQNGLLGRTPSSAQAIVLSDVVKNSLGKVVVMQSEEAQSYCAKFGGHLPTAREYALNAMTLGAVGVLDRFDLNRQLYYARGNLVATGGAFWKLLEGIPDGDHYEPIRTKNLDGNDDAFFYNQSGYTAPSDGWNYRQTFITASVKFDPYDPVNPSCWDPKRGEFFCDGDEFYKPLAFRCVMNGGSTKPPVIDISDMIDSEGFVLDKNYYSGQSEAWGACNNLGLRLMSIREIADDIVARGTGAQIAEVDKDGNCPPRFLKYKSHETKMVETNGHYEYKDIPYPPFCYSKIGYKAPAGKVGECSIYPSGEPDFLFDGKTGEIFGGVNAYGESLHVNSWEKPYNERRCVRCAFTKK